MIIRSKSPIRLELTGGKHTPLRGDFRRVQFYEFSKNVESSILNVFLEEL
jgi:hypothetical protein